MIWQFDGMLGQWVRNHASISARPLGSRRLSSKLRTAYQKKNAVIPSATVNLDPVIERAFPDTLWPPPRTATSSSLYVFAPRRTLGQMRNSFGFPLLYSSQPHPSHINGDPGHGLFLEGENAFPIVLHADDDPAILLCLIVERLGEDAHLRVRQTLGGTIGILALRVIV